MTNLIAQRPSKFLKIMLLFLFSTGNLFLGFYRNQWKVADQGWFQDFQRDTESHIIGRLVKSRQDGIFSSSGLPGMGEGLSAEAQYIAYYRNEQFNGFKPYRSQIGFQGMLFSLIDHVSPLDPANNFRVFRGITSLLLAMVLSSIILWFYLQFGLFTAILVFITTLLSQWLTVFGRNLWWGTWAFYLPMIISMYYLAYEERRGRLSNMTFALLVSVGVFIKTLLNGYEYMTTTLIMMVVPLIYYGILCKWPAWTFIKRFFLITFGSLVSIMASLTILIYQLSFIEGSFLGGVKHIAYVFGKRTYGDPTLYPEIYRESLKADPVSVVIRYFNGTMIDLNNYFHVDQRWLFKALSIEFKDVIYIFLLATLLSVVLIKRGATESGSGEEVKLTALIGATWFAISAPLSWFIIFKSHSYIHGHMNYITWHMPFTLFGFAIVGLTIQHIYLSCKFRIAPK